MSRLRTSSIRGSALVSTLLAIVVLTIIVTAFLQSMAVERQTARSYLNRLRAEQAAKSAQDAATSYLTRLLSENPYHAISFEDVSTGTSTSADDIAYPILYGSPRLIAGEDPETYFLVSLSADALKTTPSAEDARALINGANRTNSTAINDKSNFGYGWMGSPSTESGSRITREARARWIYLTKDPSTPHNSATNPYVARFAFWIDDESSKLNLRLAGNANAGGAFEQATFSTSPSDVDLGAAPFMNGLPIPLDNAPLNQALISARDSVDDIHPDTRLVNQAPGFPPPSQSTNSPGAAEFAKFYLTNFSKSNDLDGAARRRPNLNAIVTENTTEPSVIASDLDDIAYVITGNHLFQNLTNVEHEGLFHDLPDLGQDPEGTNYTIPSFGERFFTAPIPNSQQQRRYLLRIAANIRDYIDEDNQPTFVDSLGNVVAGQKPNTSWPIGSPPQAIGKEGIPFLNEHAWAATEVAWTRSGDIATATIEIDHYFEFLNPYTTDYVAPQGTFIKVYNAPTWSGGTFSDIEPTDFELDLSGVIFPAGRATIITTNPGADPPGLILDSTNLVRRDPEIGFPGSRFFPNRRTDEDINGVPGFQLFGRSSSLTDYVTEMVWGTDQGILDGYSHLSISLLNTSQFNLKGEHVGNKRRFVYSSSPRGNDAPSRTGDPRSLNEQLVAAPYNEPRSDSSRMYGNIQGNSVIPGTATFGRGAISFVNPTSWPDYTAPLQDSAARAYATLRNDPMISIGELGAIYDPRRASSSGGNINYARGGGRTLKIGQRDDVILNSSRFSQTWQKAAWRLTDLFGVDSDREKELTDSGKPGKINVNSVARDGGVALKGALRNFSFLSSPEGDAVRAGNDLSTDEINRLIESISTYIETKNGPLVERGELSELTFFAPMGGSSAGGGNTSTTNDRGREEVFQRLIEILTTRSLSFAVYSVGESVREDTNGNVIPLARAKRGIIYDLNPAFPTGKRASASQYISKPVYEIP